jgi:hypothetical protein
LGVVLLSFILCYHTALSAPLQPWSNNLEPNSRNRSWFLSETIFIWLVEPAAQLEQWAACSWKHDSLLGTRMLGQRPRSGLVSEAPKPAAESSIPWLGVEVGLI